MRLIVVLLTVLDLLVNISELFEDFDSLKTYSDQEISGIKMEILHVTITKSSDVHSAFYFRSLDLTRPLASKGKSDAYFETQHHGKEKLS